MRLLKEIIQNQVQLFVYKEKTIFLNYIFVIKTLGK